MAVAPRTRQPALAGPFALAVLLAAAILALLVLAIAAGGFDVPRALSALVRGAVGSPYVFSK